MVHFVTVVSSSPSTTGKWRKGLKGDKKISLHCLFLFFLFFILTYLQLTRMQITFSILFGLSIKSTFSLQDDICELFVKRLVNATVEYILG